MESLALLVSLLIIAMLISGVTALLLTFRKTKALSNVTVKPLQRILTIFLGLTSFIIGMQFVTQVDSLGGRVIGVFGISVASIAIYRVLKK
jgi:uncharacterized membrane protein YozB (DUF420 family)